MYTAHLHVSAYLYFEHFLQQTITAVAMAIARIAIINRRTTTPTATAITMASDLHRHHWRTGHVFSGWVLTYDVIALNMHTVVNTQTDIHRLRVQVR